MKDRVSTVRMRELGAALRKAMEGAGLEGSRVARKLGWSETKISNILNARRGSTEADIATLLAMCDVGGPERERLLRLTQDSHQIGWWQEYGERLPPKLVTLIDHEDSAVAVSQYQQTLVPGLLQSGDYARTLMRASATIPADEIEERVQARLRRQEIFNRIRPPQFRFFIDWYTVMRPGIPREIMSEQVHHLLRMSVRTPVEIRVVPEAAGFHAGANGSFMLLEFAEIKPVVHLEHETSSLFAEQEETTKAYRAILGALADVALDSEESREWISHLASELGDPSEGAT